MDKLNDSKHTAQSIHGRSVHFYFFFLEILKKVFHFFPSKPTFTHAYGARNTRQVYRSTTKIFCRHTLQLLTLKLKKKSTNHARFHPMNVFIKKLKTTFPHILYFNFCHLSG